MSPLKCAGADTGNHSQKDQVQARKQYTISCSEDINDEKEQPVEGPETPPSGSVCAFCQQDFGDVMLNKLSVYPICDNCKINLDKSIFPSWVKLFFAGVLVLVIFSIFWNWRFYSAYRNIKHANEAFGQKSFSGAANFMGEASAQVPEISDLAEMAAYFEGVNLMSKDKSTAALAQFEKCKDLSPDFHVKEYILQAEIGSDFDSKNYSQFLAASQRFLQLDTTQAQSWAGVSSAYACLYAQNNVDSLRQLSLKYINKAKTLGDTSAETKEYYSLIQYRLDSRQIITRDQFHKKFPNGYTSSNQ